MADFVDEKVREMEARLKELRPLVDEFHRLEAAVGALAGVAAGAVTKAATSARRATAPARRRRPSTGTGTGTGTGKRGRPKGSGTRGKEALALVKKTPGITIPEIAAAMKINQNYLYRVLPALAKDGLVRKDGRGWHPTEAA